MRITPRPDRQAFTLVELLIVISIIAILMAITVPAVMRALGVVQNVNAKTEITQLETSLAAARADFNNCGYLPSKLVLREDHAYNTGNAEELVTLNTLQKMFGKNVGKNLGTGGYIDWDGSGSLTSGTITLRGDRVLLFYLGGIPSGTSQPVQMTGFSTDPQNPGLSGGTRRGPFYPFKSARLKFPSNTTEGSFPYYEDSWGGGVPYVYFASGKAANSYNGTAAAATTHGPLFDYPSTSTLLSNAAVLPYYNSGNRYYNADGFQILSAGRDAKWGSTYQFDSAMPAGDGADNWSNFAPGELGKGVN